MDLLDEARRNARMAWSRGRRWFGPVLSEEEAVAIGVATLFELQAGEPDLPWSDVARRIRTRVLNSLRDEVRFLRHEVPLDPAIAATASVTSPESRLDGSVRRVWLTEQLGALAWNDRRLVEHTLLASSEARPAELPARFGSRWTIRRTLDRVLTGLRAGALERFGAA
jgi:hypothetical protein